MTLTPKEKFFRQVADNADIEKASEAAFQKEVEEFKAETLALVGKVIGWFKDSPIQIAIIPIKLAEKNHSFEVPSLLSNHGSKTMSITPSCLYSVGVTGVIEVLIEDSGKTLKKFSIHWKDNATSSRSCWTIVEDTGVGGSVHRTQFCEYTFFDRILSFA